MSELLAAISTCTLGVFHPHFLTTLSRCDHGQCLLFVNEPTKTQPFVGQSLNIMKPVHTSAATALQCVSDKAANNVGCI